ncbi:6,7-dimethyl-8-ribityllumazine synthase [Brevibacterium sp. BRM-1]|uniref:6,7-dimethyl-8-ribityllumazine synthase n=1 Tax=Brevibacterium sp. BRM-1 TaxID=2999062 RepID=UPI00228266AD|nr:6,7-dimethyl-8-ribityllumazine synthase [Brevibacterium sp. BRM-1]WAL39315.1 6,7-dimethyl-8-ribityllumazine synthase [Brevibacterium sp. BRM-1]
MARHGAPDVGLDPAAHSRVSVGIVAARWHTEVMDGLVAGALRACAEAGIEPTLVRVPGSFELPVAAQALAAHHDAVVALGVVVRGGTPHFDYVCRAAADGLGRVALDTRTPVGFGVLTCDDDEQALARAGLPGSTEDKGYEAATAAVSTAAALLGLAGPEGRG